MVWAQGLQHELRLSREGMFKGVCPSASKTGELAKVKVILSKGRADMNCKEWNSRTPVVLAAGEGHKDVVHLLVSSGADVSVVDDFGINLLHSACQGGDVELVIYVLSLGKHDINGKVSCGGTPVMLAAENGHRDVVELLVVQGANVALQDNKGDNILHFACRGGNVEVVKYVLSRDMAHINSRGSEKMTPAMMAAEKGHREVVELLFRMGADMSLLSHKGNNILHFACRGGNVEVVKYVLSRDMADINSRGSEKMTPAMMAADNRHKEVVELLFRMRADMSLSSHKGNNILHCACRGGNLEVVKFVLSQKMAGINSRGWAKSTPLLTAANWGHKKVALFLIGKGAAVGMLGFADRNILHCACRGGNVGLVKYVLSRAMADINSGDKNRMTSVLIAAKAGHNEVVQVLVSQGAKVSVKDNKGNNILHCACHGGNVELVKFVLSQRMAGINSRGWAKLTPLLTAVNLGHREVAELLISKGASVEMFSYPGRNILHSACHGGNVELVKYVLSQSMADINSRDKKRMTSILIAAKAGHKEVVQLLVNLGARVSVKDNKGNNILHLACQGGHVEVVKYVLSQNIVDINSRDWKNMTPVMMAASKGHKEVVELLVRMGAHRPF